MTIRFLRLLQPAAAGAAVLLAAGAAAEAGTQAQTRHLMHPVETGASVERVADEASPVGRWLAEDIRGGGVIDRLESVLEIAEDGKISGSGGCNRMSGKATISGEDLDFGPIAATHMACPSAVMDQEAKFFAALKEVRRWRLDPARGKLTLLDMSGRPLLVLARK